MKAMELMDKPSVLYVEDEPDDVFLVRWGFEKLGLTSQLQIVTDGQQALDYLTGRGPFANRQAHPFPSVVLSDLNLPIVSGFEVLQWIRAQPQWKTLPVIIFTSSNQANDVAMANLLGATHYFTKTAEPAGILEQMRFIQQRFLNS